MFLIASSVTVVSINHKQKGTPLSSTIANGSYARTSDGKIDFSAYVTKTGAIDADGLSIHVRINEARTRYGHLDLLVTPLAGSGQRWVEYKNIEIDGDPGKTEAPAPIATEIPEPIVAEAPKVSAVAETNTTDVLAQVRALLAKTTVK